MAARPTYLATNIGFFLGAGLHPPIVRLQYGVPLGRVAIVTASMGLTDVGGAGANTTNIVIFVNGAAFFGYANPGIAFAQSITIPDIHLNSNDIIRIDTLNALAIGHIYSGSFAIREST